MSYSKVCAGCYLVSVEGVERFIIQHCVGWDFQDSLFYGDWIILTRSHELLDQGHSFKTLKEAKAFLEERFI